MTLLGNSGRRLRPRRRFVCWVVHELGQEVRLVEPLPARFCLDLHSTRTGASALVHLRTRDFRCGFILAERVVKLGQTLYPPAPVCLPKRISNRISPPSPLG
jgi:hypothetical protein